VLSQISGSSVPKERGMASDNMGTSKTEVETAFNFSVYQAATKLPSKEFSGP